MRARQTPRMPRRRNIIRAFGALAASPLGLPSAANAVAATVRATTALALGAVAVVGTRYHAAARVAATLLPDQSLLLRRDPSNRHDPFAVAVHTPAGEWLGFLPRAEARRIARLRDAGGQVLAELDGEAFEANPGNWRIAARPSLLAEATPPQLGAGAFEQVQQVPHAPPLLAERVRGPDTGGRAVMLTGPCAGWQRTKAVEWVPPGALPLPAWEAVARHYRLAGGEAARIQTARALAEAKRLGVAVPGAAQAAPAPPAVLARPPERPRLLLRGWLPVPGRSLPAATDALRYLSLRAERGHALGPCTVTVLDRHNCPVGPLPAQAGEMVWRLIEEGYQLAIFAREPGPQATAEGHVSLPCEICLRGDDPPDVARIRAEYLLMLSDVLPTSWDAEQRFGTLPPGILRRFAERASPLADRNGGRLTEQQVEEILAWASHDPLTDHDPEREVGPARTRPARTRDRIADALASKRPGRGMPPPQRLRLVAVRLEAGLRETPQRFFPVAHCVARLGMRAKRRFLRFLVAEALVEAVVSPGCPDRVYDLLVKAQGVLAEGTEDRWARRQALVAEIAVATPRLRRRRSIHCHGAIASDRRLLLLRSIVTEHGPDALTPHALGWAIAYAMADYDRDHFVMKGAHLARRVRALADWVESEMAQAAGLAVVPTQAGRHA
jgi:hypothetical protein